MEERDPGHEERRQTEVCGRKAEESRSPAVEGARTPEAAARAREPWVLARRSRPTRVEEEKRDSRHLRGSLRESLASEDSGLADPDQRVAKFHGIYQQEDRDARSIARLTGAPRQASFMMRTRLPAGRLSAEQYLAMDRLSEELVYDRSLRITTRQNFQLHGVAKGDLRRAIQGMHAVGVTTLCGCGDVERNVVAPPAPLARGGHRLVQALAREIAAAMAPATNAYDEVWLDAPGIDASRETEPLYGDAYLPRKFKTGLALPEDDSADVHDQDVGLVCLVEGEALVGANVLVGGGAGLTHRKAETYARLATPLGSVGREQIVPTVQAIAGLFRDYGDRTERPHARLKYVVEEWGAELFRAELERRLGFALGPLAETGPLRSRDWLGPHEQGDGRWLYGLRVEHGRVIDGPRARVKTALRTLVEALRPTLVLTPQQGVLLADLAEADLRTVEQVLRAFGVPLPSEIGFVRRHALACPALPTCGLALAEAERVAGELWSRLETALAPLGVDDAPISIRMTGCPNGCARPYDADLGIVGRKPGHYDLFVGGGQGRARLGELYAESVPFDGIVERLMPLFEVWAARRRPGETLGDFYDRCLRRTSRRDLLTGAKGDAAEAALGLGACSPPAP